MRPIKFRAYDKLHRFEMAEVIIIDWNEGYLVTTESWNEDVETGEAECAARLGEVELVEFTGLLDKNGEEIYEGDVLLTFAEECRGVVTYAAPAFQIEWHAYRSLDPFFGLLDSEGEYEVIGNVYENPELLQDVLVIPLRELPV